MAGYSLHIPRLQGQCIKCKLLSNQLPSANFCRGCIHEHLAITPQPVHPLHTRAVQGLTCLHCVAADFQAAQSAHCRSKRCLAFYLVFMKPDRGFCKICLTAVIEDQCNGSDASNQWWHPQAHPWRAASHSCLNDALACIGCAAAAFDDACRKEAVDVAARRAAADALAAAEASDGSTEY